MMTDEKQEPDQSSHYNQTAQTHEILETLEACIAKLKPLDMDARKKLIQKDNILSEYTRLLAIKDNAYSLLTVCGDPFQLAQEATRIYLLPPIVGVKRNTRWVLCQDQAQKSAPNPSVQILQWHTRQIKQNPITKMHDPFSVTGGAELENRALSLAVTQEDEEVLIVLKYRQGRLRIFVDLADGITDARWKATKAQTRQQERYSAGAMETALWVEPQYGENWRHDVLYDQKSQTIQGAEFGYITGVDGDPEQQKVYFGGAGAKIYGLDLTHEHTSTPSSISSESLGEKVFDVTVLDHPDKANEKAVLTSSYDGNLYLLEPDWQEKTLKTIYYQSCGISTNIVQVIGQENRRVLMVESNQGIFSLALQSPAQFNRVYGEMTDLLFAVLRPTLTDHRYLYDEGAMLLRVYYEYILRSIKDKKHVTHEIALFTEFCGKISQDYQQQSENQNERLARFHHGLLKRLWTWLESLAFKPEDSEQCLEQAIGFITPLLNPATCAPDWLWMKIFRKHDLLTNPVLQKNQKLTAHLTTLFRYVQHMRKALMPGMAKIQTLTGSTSTKMAQPPYRMSYLKQSNVIAMLDYNRGLSIQRYPAGGLSPQNWEEIVSAVDDRLGHCSVLITGHSLNALLKNKNTVQQFLLVVVGTKLTLYQLAHGQDKRRAALTQLWQVEIPYVIYSGKVVLSPNNRGVLLAGYNSDRQACLIWVSVHSTLVGPKFREIWCGAPLSYLREIMVDDRACKVWAVHVTKSRSEIRCWALSSDLFSDKPQPPDVWLEHTQKLNTIWLNKDRSLLLCGGNGGLIFALATQSGELKWAVGCGGHVSCIRYVQNVADDSGVWLVAGDMRHVFMFNDNGVLTGLFENKGPITSLSMVDGQRVLIGSRAGRVLMAAPCEYSVCDNARDRQFSLTKPLTNPQMLQDQSLRSLLKKLSDYQQTGTSEFFPIIMLYLTAAEKLRNDNSVDVFEQFAQLLNREPPQRIAYLLVQSAIVQFSDDNLVRLLYAIWSYEQQKNTPSMCIMIIQMLTLLEQIVLKENNQQPLFELAQQLLADMQNCIWGDVKGYECPKLTQRFRLKKVQISQFVRAWSETSGSELSERLAKWLDKLAKIWQVPSMDQMRKRLHIIFQEDLRFVLNDDGWFKWVATLANPSQLSPKTHPKALQPLADAQLLAWHDGIFNALHAVWPNNMAWRQWLHGLQRWLNSYKGSQYSPGKEMWRIWDNLQGLEAHVRDVGPNSFTFVRYPLLALWWPYLMEQWQEQLSEAKNSVQQRCYDQIEDYFDYNFTDRWHSKSLLTLDVALNNRHPNGLTLEKVIWRGESIALPQQPNSDKPVNTLETHWNRHLIFKQLTATENVVNDDLTFHMTNALTNRTIEFTLRIQCERGLSRFSQHPSWNNTLQRLEHLLKAKTPFHWVDGVEILEDDRKRLRQLIIDQYGVSPEPIASLGAVVQDNNPVFSPDLWLNQDNAGRLLEQVHGLIHQHRTEPMFDFLAYAIWRQVHETPQAILCRLEPEMPTVEQVDGLLARLLGRDLSRAMLEKLRALPQAAMGAWVCGALIYADDSCNFTAEERKESLYPSTASMIGLPVWQLLLGVSDKDISQWLGQTIAETVAQKKQRTLLQRFWRNQKPQQMRLLANHLQSAIDLRVKFTEQSKNIWMCPTEVVLLHGVYAFTYLYNQIGAESPDIQSYSEDALWLCLRESDRPPAPRGQGVTLSQNQCLNILHSRAPEEAKKLLNQYARKQHPINPRIVFRASGGMGDGIDGMSSHMVMWHFSGRSDELGMMHTVLRNADQGQSGALAITGGRRMGKTSLRQRFLYEVKKESPNRVCMSLDLQSFVRLSHPKLTAAGVAYEFFQFLQIGVQAANYTLDFGWDNAKKDNTQQMLNAKQKFRDFLIKIKSGCHLTPVVFMDETEAFFTYDQVNGWQITNFLRELVASSSLCLFATSYPHGIGVPHAITNCVHNSKSGAFNLFTAGECQLSRWSPQECWDYLHDKLAGFGIILPFTYFDEVVNVSCGCPWIVHLLGLNICDALYGKRAQRFVRHAQWVMAKSATLLEIERDLHTTIESIAKQDDLYYKVDFTVQPNDVLSQRLWNALHNIAYAHVFQAIQTDGQWSPLVRFSVHDITKQLGNKQLSHRIRAVFNQLSSSIVLEGVCDSEDHFLYSCNLLPMWVNNRRMGQ